MSTPVTLHGRRGLMLMTIEHFILERFNFEGRWEIYDRSKEHWHTLSRFVVFRLLQKHLHMPSTQIGRLFDMDHTSVLYGLKKLEKMELTEAIDKQFMDYVPPRYLWTTLEQPRRNMAILTKNWG